MTAPTVTPGAPYELGARTHQDGTNVAVWAPDASRVALCVFTPAEAVVAMPACTAGVWHAKVRGLGHGAEYLFEVEDADGTVVRVLDPYARAVTPTDDGLRAVVVDDIFDWHGDSSPRVPLDRTVIYEAHVRGLTMLHPDVPVRLRGTYAGVAYPAVLDHLERLGVTTLELMPVQEFITEPLQRDSGRVNYWGYNPVAFSAPHGAYATGGTHGEQVREFKEMVRALHTRGIEVVLDVVYNHTGEGSEEGPLVGPRALDDDGYYRRADGSYLDLTGCGNTLRASNPGTERLILDSLRYWAVELHVDGFRFDLASALARNDDHVVDVGSSVIDAIARDPVLSTLKLIAEPWDASSDGYLLGRFPAEWSEWNDRYRDGVRDFWRGAPGGVRALASRISGSAAEFTPRGPLASVNLVTAHDGFTLRDLVSYNERHNDANDEWNLDGHEDNRSWNCGVEGDTDDPQVLAIRRRQAANLLTTLLLSAGVPMLASGDEWARTQHGNNNAYCQDNEISWLPWRADPGWGHLEPLVAGLVRLRAGHPAYAGNTHKHGGDSMGSGRKDIGWLHPRGHEMSEADWFDDGLNSLAMFLDGGPDDPALLVLMHAGSESVGWTLPDTWWSPAYEVAIDTADRRVGERPAASDHLTLPAHSALVLLGTVHERGEPETRGTEDEG
ncbi:glycogen debranching protein GlgX [Solicola gregarius]|uniref:Glycogen debranching protein GlgX n=1 Tax=Solicola gregarius TaxID=2908642 RepID=A0AA46YLS5_9ACTN|nr:glycogen debranching protein GlgX [Solicola gregarius]UYM05894.1 glycogen debranching protein GlgX [Solicola gregarius]